MKKPKLEAFTLIEVMVVITIASLLAVAIYANFSGARTSAINKAIQTELKETQLALELYKSQNGSYPPAHDIANLTGCADSSGGVDTAYSDSCGSNPIIDGLIPDYTSELYDSEKSNNPDCRLVYQVENSNGTWYKLVAENCFSGATEASEGVQPSHELSRCASTCPDSGSCDQSEPSYYESYAVYSPGGQCH